MPHRISAPLGKSARAAPLAWAALTLAAVTLAAAPRAEAASFASPSGNILCYTPGSLGPSEEGLVCLIFSADWAPPLHEPCELDQTAAIHLPPSGPPIELMACHGDVFWPSPAPQLSYGSEWALPDYRCTMAQSGVTCTNASGNGLQIARRGRSLF